MTRNDIYETSEFTYDKEDSKNIEYFVHLEENKTESSEHLIHLGEKKKFRGDKVGKRGIK